MSTSRPTVTDALFGNLPPEARERFGLEAPDGTADTTSAADIGASNASIKARKASTAPPLVEGGAH